MNSEGFLRPLHTEIKSRNGFGIRNEDADMLDYSHAFEIIKRFDQLPDDAVVQTKVTALILGVSERTVRYSSYLPRVQLSPGRYGQRVRDIRALVRNGIPAAAT
jgi:hypothetical protein